MEKGLELLLIEEGFDATRPRATTLSQAGQYIEKQLTRKHGTAPKRMLLFNGTTEVWVSLEEPKAFESNTLGQFHLKKPAIVIEGDHSGGLRIFSAYDRQLGGEDSVMCLPGGFSIESKRRGRIMARHKTGMYACITFNPYDAHILYVRRMDNATADKRFWEHVAGRFGLKLTKTKPPKKEEMSRYTSKDAESGVELTLGTIRLGHYVVIATFPQPKSAADLQRILDDNSKINVFAVDSKPFDTPITRSGKTIEASTYRGRGEQLVAYLANLLRGHPYLSGTARETG